MVVESAEGGPTLQVLPPCSSVLLSLGSFQILSSMSYNVMWTHRTRSGKTPRLENVPEAPSPYSPPPRPAMCLPVTRREAWGPVTASVRRRCKVAVAARYTHSLQSGPVYLPGETRGTRGNEAAGGRGPAEGWRMRGRNATCWWTSAWAAGSQLISHCLVARVL